MNHEADRLRLHMGCGEPLRSQLLLGVPRYWLHGIIKAAKDKPVHSERASMQKSHGGRKRA